MSAPNVEGTVNTSVYSGGTTIGSTVGSSAASLAGFHGAAVVQATGYGTPTGNVKTADFAGTANIAVTAAQLSSLLIDLKAKGIIGA